MSLLLLRISRQLVLGEKPHERQVLCQCRSYTESLTAVQDLFDPSTWSYTQIGSNLGADVSYDMFTSSTFGDAHQYEVMIWLAALGGAGPISSSYNAQGAVPVATGLTIAGPSGYTKARMVAHR